MVTSHAILHGPSRITPIRRRLLELGKTQTAFAQEVGVTGATVSDWVHHRTTPHAKRIRKVAISLELQPAELIDLLTEGMQ